MFDAVEQGDTDKIKLAWLDGIPVDIRNDVQQTPLHVAVLTQQIGVIELLLAAQASVTAVDAHGQTPIKLAMQHEYHQIVDLFRSYEQRANGYDLASNHAFLAAKRGDVRTLEKLVTKGLDVNVRDYDDRYVYDERISQFVLP